MSLLEPGNVLLGDVDELMPRVEAMAQIPVDLAWAAPADWQPDTCQHTVARPFHVTSHGTYERRQASTLYFEPYEDDGWWIDRTDNRRQLPIRVSIRNVWTTVRSIVLRSGAPHNYLRMVEHIIALRLGLGVDNIILRIDSGDPPLFNVGSEPIVEELEKAGRCAQPDRPLTYWTVKEPVTVLGPNGSFLHISPDENNSKRLSVDCAIDFKTAIGQQRVQFDLCPETFRHGSKARTNCSLAMVWFCWTVGKLFADMRNLGYTRRNILVAGRKTYKNDAKLVHDGKSLEAVWHRATLDLFAALSLVETGRIAGKITSFKAGHALDVELVTQLYLNDLLTPLE